jgi:hypothetical protein
MASYTVIPRRLGGLYPFCIDRVEADGSIVTIDRRPTEALAVNRLEDIEEEAAVNERRASLLRSVGFFGAEYEGRYELVA